MYKHTLCFIKRNEEILMLNREYDPVKGLWNGVGGENRTTRITVRKCDSRNKRRDKYRC